MERAMKVQDVMLQAMAKKITWWQAAEILGISDRHMRRCRERYEEHQHLDGTLSITHGPHRLGHYTAQGAVLTCYQQDFRLKIVVLFVAQRLNRIQPRCPDRRNQSAQQAHHRQDARGNQHRDRRNDQPNVARLSVLGEGAVESEVA